MISFFRAKISMLQVKDNSYVEYLIIFVNIPNKKDVNFCLGIFFIY
ncbi:MAG: hypothetical protein K0R90_457 [Oscillospiraceae bacterium]|jgi:hypothetical protein|nr:hypothetical protein [Oscillospiraceae bacterium]